MSSSTNELATTESHATFARALASPDKSIRDKTMKTLVKYLASLEDLTDLEMLKLWKALYYCMWLSDKAVIQLELATSLSSELFRSFRSPTLAYKYLRMFYRTILREWHMLDQHRINKFYTLIRLMLREMLLHMCLKRWNETTITLLLTILQEEILTKLPNGPRLHIADIFLEELWIASNGGETVDTKVFLRLMAPFLQIIASCLDPVFQERVSKQVFAAFAGRYARELSNQPVDDEDEEEEETASSRQLFEKVHTPAIQAAVFDLAGDATGHTAEKNRRKLYALHLVFPPVTGQAFANVDETEETAMSVSRSDSEKRSKKRDDKPVATSSSNGNNSNGKGNAKVPVIGKGEEQTTKKRKAIVEEEEDDDEEEAVVVSKQQQKKKLVATPVSAASSAITNGSNKKQKTVTTTTSAVPISATSSSSSSSTATSNPPTPPSIPSFAASPRFEGRRPGCVFKKGKQGLGYYQDALMMKQLHARPQQQSQQQQQRRHSTGSTMTSSSIKGSGTTGTNNNSKNSLSNNNSSSSGTNRSSSGSSSGSNSNGLGDSPKKVTFGKPQVRRYDKFSSSSTVNHNDSDGDGDGDGGSARSGKGHDMDSYNRGGRGRGKGGNHQKGRRASNVY